MAALALAFDILAKDNASKTFDKVSKSAKNTGDQGTDLGKKMGAGMKVAAVAALTLGAAAVAGFGAFIKDAAYSAKVGRMTEAVIKSTGGAAKITAAQVGDLATAISNKTGADDEAVQTAANMLLTFTNVRNEVGKGNDIFNQATQTVTDMSAALGTDMKASSVQLGKALNDPVKGITALSKVGVSFTQQQKDQIKVLVKSGNTMGAQKIILKELGKEFGGAAAAASDPMTRLQVIVGNLGEKLGGYLLPYVNQFADWIGNKAVPAISDFADEMGPKLAPIIERVKTFIGDVIGKVKTFIVEFQNGEGAGGKFRDVLTKLVDTVKDVSKWIGDNQTLVKSLVVSLGTAVVIIKTVSAATKAYAVVQALLNVVLTANPIGIIIVAIAGLAAGIIYAYKNSETFRNKVDDAFRFIKIAALTLSGVAIGAFQKLINFWFTVVQGLLDGAAKAFGWVPGLGPKLQTAADGFRTFKDTANRNLDKIQNDIQLKIKTEEAAAALEKLHRDYISKGWTVTAKALVNVTYQGNGMYGGGSGGGADAGPPRGGGKSGGLLRPVNAAAGHSWGRYASGGLHRAIDFPTAVGTPLRAPLSGRVMSTTPQPGGFGTNIRTADADGNYSIFGHLSRLLVSAGQSFSRGQIIGLTGNTGRSSGPHLHYERRHIAYEPSSSFNYTNALGRNRGGPVWPGGMFAVGDNKDGSWNKTTELFRPNVAGRIYTQDQLASIGGGPSREVHVHYSGVGMSPRDLVQEAYREERKTAALSRNYGD